MWDIALEIPTALKKLQKFRLGVSQEQFSQLEYQLYCVGCVTTKENQNYTYAARTVELPNTVYIPLQRYIPFYKLLFLCMWRHLNKKETIPSSTFTEMLEEDTSIMDEEDEEGVIKGTRIRLNAKHVIQHCMWTVKQRKAVANTRDYFFNDFEREEPMIFDLPFSPSNKKVIRDFIVGMWKAEIDDEIIFHICAELMGLQEFYPRPKPTRLRRRASVQRKSITEATIQDRSIIAAIIIQDFYRQRLERRRNAVKLIEIAWEPLRLEGIEARRSLQESFHAMAEATENSKDFNWDKFSKTIKEDYLSIAQPLEEPRETIKGDRYWLKVALLLSIPVGIASAVYLLTDLRYRNIELTVFIIYVIAALMMLLQMGNIYWLYFQTFWNLTLLAFLINVMSDSQVMHFVRLYILTFIVAAAGKKWSGVAFLYLLLRNIYSIIGGNAGFVHYIANNTFDIYGIITIATASRRGSPIEMLHKLSVNIVVGVFVLGGVAAGLFTSCLVIEQGELPV